MVVIPAVSMSEKKTGNHQRSLLCKRCHVTYTNLYRGIWQRQQWENVGRKHKNHQDVTQHTRLFLQVHGYKDSWQDFYSTSVMNSTENYTKYNASVTFVIHLVG